MAVALIVLLPFSRLSAQIRSAGVFSQHGMVSCAHPEASKIGVEILRKGGNAFDAAVAIQFALTVAYPRAGNIGGGGFMVYRTQQGDIGCLDFREKAPAAAHTNMFLDSLGNPMPKKSLLGALAAGVPGSVDGMVTIHKQLGSLPWKALLQPAINLADYGVVLTEREANKLNEEMGDLLTIDPHSPLSRKGGWKAGERIYYPGLAATLSRIRDRGREGFYNGKTARLLLREMHKRGGIITQKDLDAYTSVWRTPITFSYRDRYRMISMPLPSSGGLSLCQLFTGLEAYPVAEMRHNSAETIHVMTELAKRTYADRASYLGDSDFEQVPVEKLQDKDYIRTRMQDISMQQATPAQQIKAGNVRSIESFETTHFSVVDQWGNAVAITTTLNGNYGCKVFVAGGGFFLNNEMDDFSIKPGIANQFGLTGNMANAIKPGKRMLSSMTPTIVEKDGKLLLVAGSPGGATIITSVWQTLVNVIDFGMSMQEAVNAKRFHAQWLPDKVYLEQGVHEDTIRKLERLGHHIEHVPALGKLDCILVYPDGRMEGASDIYRSDGCALGL